MYDPALGRFMVQDRFAEKYHTMTPYQYAANNPVLMIDINGDSTYVAMNDNGTYNVVGGSLEGDDNGIYIRNEDGTIGDMVGYSATPESFYNSDEGQWMGTIDPNDQSGRNFLNKQIVADNPGVFEYMSNAKGGEPLDFKRTNGTDKVIYDTPKDFYRGMPLSLQGDDASMPVFGSARDVGNIGAGLVAGRNGKGWGVSRIAFNALESWQKGRLATESTSTQYGEKLGHRIGSQMYSKSKASRLPGNGHLRTITISTQIIKKGGL
jgi:hypothetical protein